MTRQDVRETYDRIATHFSLTRQEPWEEVEAFLEGRTGEVGLDIGVGNGRHAELLAARCPLVIGLDLSRAILSEAEHRMRERSFELSLLQGDATTLPLCAGTVDLAVYVATIHHLPSRPLRISSLNELARVLSSSGRAIISAWCVTHDRFDAEVGFDTTVDWTLPDGDTVERFYHIFDAEEFAREIEASDLHRVSTFVSRGNCYAIVRPEQ